MAAETLGPSAGAPEAEHGRPYTPGDILRWTQSLPVPLRERWVADIVASRVWTYDGQPYRQIRITGECDEAAVTCTISVVGEPAFAAMSTDEVHLTLAMATREVRDALLVLIGFPAARWDEVDAAVRALVPNEIGDRSLRLVSWLPEPAAGDAFLLRYSHGTGEGDQQVEIEFDRAANVVHSVTPLEAGS